MDTKKNKKPAFRAWNPVVTKEKKPTGTRIKVQWNDYSTGKRVQRVIRFSDQSTFDVWIKEERKRRKIEQQAAIRENSENALVHFGHLSSDERAAVAMAIELMKANGGHVFEILPAVQNYVDHQLVATQKTLGEVFEEYMAVLSDGIRSDRTVYDRRYVLKTLIDQFATYPLMTVGVRDIEDWILSHPGHATRSARRRAAMALFNYAVHRGYCETNIVEKTMKIGRNRRSQDVVIWKPAAVQRLLGAAQETCPELIPYIALTTFAGLRPEKEARNTAWDDFDFINNVIIVHASRAKTVAKRMVPMSANFKAWIEMYPPQSKDGTIYYSKAKMNKLLKHAKVPMHQDVARHTFCSYRQRVIQNIHQLCEEAGNTPSIARTNYLNPRCTVAEAKAFWGPESVADGQQIGTNTWTDIEAFLWMEAHV